MDDHSYERFLIKMKLLTILVLFFVFIGYLVCGLFGVLPWMQAICSMIKAIVITLLLSLDIILLAAIVRNYRNH